MKKIMTIAIVFVFYLTLFASVSFAHPPSKIEITYDPATKLLSAVITHHVKDVTKHYIKRVTIGCNVQTILQKDISQQDNNTTQTVTCPIPNAKKGDTLFVEGECNLFGKKAEHIVVQ
jgi:hypothetical protein